MRTISLSLVPIISNSENSLGILVHCCYQIISDLHSLLLHGKHSSEAEQGVLVHCHFHDPGQSALLRRLHHRRRHQDENFHAETQRLLHPSSDLPEGESALGVHCEMICLFIFIYLYLFFFIIHPHTFQSLEHENWRGRHLSEKLWIGKCIRGLILSESQLAKVPAVHSDN